MLWWVLANNIENGDNSVSQYLPAMIQNMKLSIVFMWRTYNYASASSHVLCTIQVKYMIITNSGKCTYMISNFTMRNIGSRYWTYKSFVPESMLILVSFFFALRHSSMHSHSLVIDTL